MSTEETDAISDLAPIASEIFKPINWDKENNENQSNSNLYENQEKPGTSTNVSFSDIPNFYSYTLMENTYYNICKKLSGFKILNKIIIISGTNPSM